MLKTNHEMQQGTWGMFHAVNDFCLTTLCTNAPTHGNIFIRIFLRSLRHKCYSAARMVHSMQHQEGAERIGCGKGNGTS